MTPLLRPVCPVATAGAASSTTAERSRWRRVSSRATARPRMPPPTTARSHARGAEAISAGLLLGYSAREQLEVGVEHQPDHLLEAGARLPAELFPGLGGVADEVLDLGGTQKAWIGSHMGIRIHPYVLERDPDEVANTVGLAGRDHEVFGLLLLEHQPHRLDVVLGVAPVTFGVEIAEQELVLEAELDGGGAVGDLARDELEAAALPFVIERDTRHREEVVGLAVIDRDEVPVALCDSVGRAGVEGRRLGLRNLADLAEHLRR